MVAKRKKEEDDSTAEKIKLAAHKLFIEKGFDAVTTRDIAAEAGSNSALLHYYFGSKEKLFDIIMIEVIEKFSQFVKIILADETLTFEEMITRSAESYIDILKANPNLPLFILNEMTNNSSKITSLSKKNEMVRNSFFKRIDKAMGEGKIARVHGAQFMLNFIGMVIFPFMAQSVLLKLKVVDAKEIDAIMEERKKMIPVWLKAIMTAK